MDKFCEMGHKMDNLATLVCTVPYSLSHDLLSIPSYCDVLLYLHLNHSFKTKLQYMVVIEAELHL